MGKAYFVYVLLLFVGFTVPLFSQGQSHYSVSNAGNPDNDYYEGYRMGQMQANSGVWWGVSSLVGGCSVGAIVPIGAIVGGGIPVAVAVLHDPKPPMIHVQNKGQDYINGYKDGYAKAQKTKNITSAAIGAGVSTVIAVGTAFLIAASLDDDDYYYKTDPTHPHKKPLSIPIIGFSFGF